MWVDDAPPRLAAGQVGLLLPDHRERFAFDPDVATRHSWVQAHVPDLPAGLEARLERLPKLLPLSPALDALAREAVATAAGALPTASSVLAHLAGAALSRYIGEAERGAPERSLPSTTRRASSTPICTTRRSRSATLRAPPTSPPRSFRAEHGATPTAYLWQRRARLGVDLLTNTGLSLAAVADLRLQDGSSRVEQATGLPPATLRRARWDPAVTSSRAPARGAP